MDENHDDLPEILALLDPSCIDYLEWTQIGMALKDSGFSCDVWDEWSARDSARYHEGECERKWRTFTQSGIGSGTIIHIAEDHGVDLSSITSVGRALDWDDEIVGTGFYPQEKDESVFIDRTWVEGEPINVPTDEEWEPIKEITTYLETLFEADEFVGFVMDSWEKDGRYLPTQGIFSKTSSQLIQDLNHYQDIGMAMGDYNPAAGAWVRFNALDGKGVRNSNVSEFRFALVESDNMSKELQYALIKQLELPVATLVDSGNKSLHAVVRVDAADYNEYRKRVDQLYEICQKNGLKLDTQNKNPSRLSRLPGIMRSGKKQHLIATNIGKSSWVEWWEWIQAINDDLPEPEDLASVWNEMPELAPPLIDGVLRQGHKMLLAGPSKAGKSYALIELCIALAEGREWLGWKCTQGRVLYVNLELDRPSAFHRFKEVYQALGWEPQNVTNIDIWNLRGKSVPMDKLAPKLIRRSLKKGYIAVVIDPIYKVITGDENSADQMAAFCNSFDLVANQLGCAVIYCHHHSKGAQGGKRSMDRASGSGVFARDPDALIDMSELEITDECREARQKELDWLLMQEFMGKRMPNWREELTPDEQAGPIALCAWASKKAPKDLYLELLAIGERTKAAASSWTAWRLDGTLREFPKFGEKNVWFDYPLHKTDYSGMLGDLRVEGEYVDMYSAKGKRLRDAGREKAISKRKEEQKEKNEIIKTAIEGCSAQDKKPTRQNIVDYIDEFGLWEGITKKTIQNWTSAKWCDYKAEKDEDGTWIVTSTKGKPIDWDSEI